MQELKPCPCCGSAIGLYVLQDEKYGEWSVFCDICKTSLHNENHCDTRDDAISAWNRRAERTCRMEKDDRYSEMYEGPMLRCTRCDAPIPEIFTGQYNYCPNCGAKVIGETE